MRLVSKYFSIAKRARGKKIIAIASVPYAIQTTTNPQNIYAILLIKDPMLVTLNALINR